jgi:Acetyltransferase (GNAT) domain
MMLGAEEDVVSESLDGSVNGGGYPPQAREDNVRARRASYLVHCRARTRGCSSRCSWDTGPSEATARGPLRIARVALSLVASASTIQTVGRIAKSPGPSHVRNWGRGYALEAASAALQVPFEVLGWQRIISLIAGPNLRSIRLAERLGERFERTLEVRGHEIRLYSMDRAQWGVA